MLFVVWLRCCEDGCCGFSGSIQMALISTFLRTLAEASVPAKGGQSYPVTAEEQKKLEPVLKRLKQRDVQSYFLSVLQEQWLK